MVAGAGSTLPEHRAQHVAAVSGERARRYLQRQHLLALGAEALAYLTELTHRRPRTWIHDVEQLHELLQAYGEAALRAAFTRGLAEQAIGAEYIAHYLDAGPSRPCRLSRRPAADDTGSGTPARRPGPGRRRRPEGRRGAPRLDAA